MKKILLLILLTLPLAARLAPAQTYPVADRAALTVSNDGAITGPVTAATFRSANDLLSLTSTVSQTVSSPLDFTGSVAFSGPLQVPHENRPLGCVAYKGSPVTGSGSFVIFDTATLTYSGPGCVNYIQILGTLGYDLDLKITVDGVALPQFPLQEFISARYTNTMTPPYVFLTDFLGTSFSGIDTGGLGGYRYLFIPFATSCKIEAVNLNAGSQTLYSQVQYRLGANPWNVYGPLRKKLHVVYNPPASLAGHGTLALIPTITSSGVIESVQLSVKSETGYAPNYDFWLEGATTITADGVVYTYGGTEDFYGTHFYGHQTIGRMTNFAGMPLNASVRYLGSTVIANNCFRIFKEDPPVFNSWMNFNYINGSDDPITASSLTFFYTEN